MRDIEFHGCQLNAPGFGDSSSAVLAITIADAGEGEDLFLIFNMESLSLPFQLPPVIGRCWYRALDTALADAVVWSAPGTEVVISSDSYLASGRSVQRSTR